MVVGHPKDNEPAFGWCKGFKRVGDKLIAEPEHVNADFAAMVKDKKFRKVSMAFFRPEEASNPKPGVWYPRHWGFLGAAAPAVTGLKPIQFASGDGFAEFSTDYALLSVAGFWRRLREWFLTEFGKDAADGVVPEWSISSMEGEAEKPDSESDNPNFFAPPAKVEIPKEHEMSEQDKQELERLRADNARLQAKEQEHAAARKAAATAARRAEFSALADALVKEGKLLPVDRDAVIEFAAALPEELSVEFSAADGTKTATPGAQFFKSFLARLPKQVPLGSAADPEPEAPSVDFAAPKGMDIDPESLAVHKRATAYQAQHKCDYITAVRAVGDK